jgi:hypothetical protein
MHSQQSSSVRTRMSSKRSLIQITFPNTKNDTLVFDLTKTSTLVAAVRAMPRIFPIGDVPVSQDEVLCDVENSYIIRGPLGPKKVYQNRLQSQASIPSRLLTCIPGANNCPADGLYLVDRFSGYRSAICTSSLEIDSSFTSLCPFIRPKLFRYGLVVVGGYWSRFRVDIR